METCREHDIAVIEDCAQAPRARYGGRFAGSIGDCGGFSFTQSKCVMSGEGGILVTNNSDIAHTAQMIRNHGEATEYGKSRSYDSEFLGMGYRMTEIAAAIGSEQWKKLDHLNHHRIRLNSMFIEYIKEECGFIEFQDASYDHKHVYYVTPMLYNEQLAGVPRSVFAAAVRAEGVNIMEGYIKPLYLQSIYQNRAHIALDTTLGISYDKGICPNAEELHGNRFMMLMDLRYPLDDEMLEQIKHAFHKVINNMGSL